MSLTVVSSKKVYADINDLPENMGINDGDRFIVQTDEGTALVDYENIKIDLEHTTFGSVIGELQEFQGLATDFITKISSEFTIAQGDISVLKTREDTLEQQVEAVRYLLKLVLGLHSGDSEEAIELDKGDLSQEGQDFVTEVYGSVRELDAEFSLSTNNLRNITKNIGDTDINTELEDIKATNALQDDSIANIQASLSEIVAELMIPTGVIVPFAGMSPPAGWLMCDGQKVSGDQYPKLYEMLRQCVSLIDSIGDVHVPDLQGRYPKGREASTQLCQYGESTLPNIRGDGLFFSYEITNPGTLWGALQPLGWGSQHVTPSSSMYENGDGGWSPHTGFQFNAASYNSVYRDGADVNPKNISLNYIIKC